MGNILVGLIGLVIGTGGLVYNRVHDWMAHGLSPRVAHGMHGSARRKS
jgi:hypothetical protein